ncbi:hypothetical protein BpHYR1_009306, partial [Brachionus plicatilis]
SFNSTHFASFNINTPHRQNYKKITLQNNYFHNIIQFLLVQIQGKKSEKKIRFRAKASLE